MKVLERKYTISNSDLTMVLKDVELSKMLCHFIESMKHLHPAKFVRDSSSQDIFEVGNVIDFQYARLYNALENDPRFKEYVISLLSNPDYKDMEIDEFFSVMKPVYLAG
ncbi:MAG TPA: hypothetical protein VK186_06755 [Candidatus Deferrimicrobium sp.]|nr:hypothetical protein [Candidatus Deferrimicrobium sp.]